MSPGDFPGSEPLKSSAFPSMSFTSKAPEFGDMGENRDELRVPLKDIAVLVAARLPSSEGTTCRSITGAS